MLGEENATDAELMETGRRFFTAMYGQPEGTSMSLARYNLYTRKKGKPLRIMALPPTEANLLFHMKSSHAGDVVESSRSARISPICGHHQVRMGHEELASITISSDGDIYI